MNKKLSKGLCAGLGVAALLTAAPAAATLVLEGSDATTFHGAQTGGDTYTTQLFSFIRQGSALPVAVLDAGDDIPFAPVGTVFTNDLSGLSTATYSALYIQAIGGCCSQNLAEASLWSAQISAFTAAGGSVVIQDYTGGDWSFVSPLLVTPPVGAVMGYDTGGGGPTCTDAQVFNNEALIRGFTQPPPLGCWEHQAYSMDYFGALGFLSLVDADPSYFGFDNTGKPLGSALLAFGGALGDPGCTNPAGCDNDVPEPAPIALISLALGGLGLVIRRRQYTPNERS